MSNIMKIDIPMSSKTQVFQILKEKIRKATRFFGTLPHYTLDTKGYFMLVVLFAMLCAVRHSLCWKRFIHCCIQSLPRKS